MTPPDDRQAQRLEKAGGEAVPGQAVQVAVDAIHDPDVALPGGQRRPGAAGEEVEPGDHDPPLEDVVLPVPGRALVHAGIGGGDAVDDVGARGLGTLAPGQDRRGPVAGAAGLEGGQARRAGGVGQRAQHAGTAAGGAGDQHLEQNRALAARQVEQQAAAAGVFQAAALGRADHPHLGGLVHRLAALDAGVSLRAVAATGARLCDHARALHRQRQSPAAAGGRRALHVGHQQRQRPGRVLDPERAHERRSVRRSAPPRAARGSWCHRCCNRAPRRCRRRAGRPSGPSPRAAGRRGCCAGR